MDLETSIFDRSRRGILNHLFKNWNIQVWWGNVQLVWQSCRQRSIPFTRGLAELISLMRRSCLVFIGISLQLMQCLYSRRMCTPQVLCCRAGPSALMRSSERDVQDLEHQEIHVLRLMCTKMQGYIPSVVELEAFRDL